MHVGGTDEIHIQKPIPAEITYSHPPRSAGTLGARIPFDLLLYLGHVVIERWRANIKDIKLTHCSSLFFFERYLRLRALRCSRFRFKTSSQAVGASPMIAEVTKGRGRR